MRPRLGNPVRACRDPCLCDWYCRICGCARHLPDRVPSQFLIADALLLLDDQYEKQLLRFFKDVSCLVSVCITRSSLQNFRCSPVALRSMLARSLQGNGARAKILQATCTLMLMETIRGGRLREPSCTRSERGRCYEVHHGTLEDVVSQYELQLP